MAMLADGWASICYGGSLIVKGSAGEYVGTEMEGGGGSARFSGYRRSRRFHIPWQDFPRERAD